MPENLSVGIVSVGTYVPEPVMTAADIAAASGIDEWVIREKFGITQKHVPGPDDHTNAMAIWAAQDCLSRSEIPADEIDVVLCTTEEWKEYLLWTAGIKLAQEIGATRAWAIDVQMRCGTTIAALKMAKDMMIADPDVNTVLIAGGYRNGDLIDYRNPRTSFMYNLGAGAGALLLRKGWPKNHVLGSHLMTDGAMSEHVIVPASGTKQFPTDEARAKGLFFLDLVEPEAMKNRLNAVSMDNWMHCIDEALRKSGGLTREDVRFLNVLHMKPSAHKDMLQRLGLREEQSVYLSEYGHIGQQDAMFSIMEGLKQGRLKDGDVMAIVAAGIGYAWGAACVRWGSG
ncbi:MAG: 3-oxoacyl-ACP synthase [Anaerolineae bacterium]|jgi:3-oxoacyl-[acyl-carrier-protein] synthase-3|nr:3-oxoacyl-ACP synthase [Anaerolineae bacterium]